jgi:serine/threonine-protein kinase
MRWVMEKDRVEVPRLVGLDSIAASELLKEVGLAPRVIAEEFSAHIPKGRVTSQRPARGTRVRLGSEVRLILSRGSDLLEVPDVAGGTLPQAQRILVEAGLNMGPVLKTHSHVHAREAIIAQDPPPKTPAMRGAKVTLLQSLGPWEEMVAMPDLHGREMVTALNLLKELQLEARLSFERSVSPRGVVVGQDPPPGGRVKVGDQVQLTIGE